MMRSSARRRLLELLRPLYGEAAEATLARIEELAARHRRAEAAPARARWSERDIVLIAYGDQIRAERGTPLAALRAFLLGHGLERLFSIVHLLPFFPSTSDDGFAVADYRRVDPALGTWRDVAALGRSFDLMMDLVLNHCSRSHRWFRGYLEGEEPYRDYFIEADPEADFSAVVRPRSTPLLTAVETRGGCRHVWTTFGADQVDLDFRNPEVLLEMLQTVLLYVERGARIVRLDAVAFLWKEIGTSCLHLPQTHAIVQLMRTLLEEVAPGTLLLTETNVPHEENVSYFGAGDEAHLVYQFSLPPLLLDACLSGDARVLRGWLGDLEAAGPFPAGTTFLNFTASHDGIGVRPLEGLVPERRLRRLLAAIGERGGRVSTRRRPDGRDAAYELNIAWTSAFAGASGRLSALAVRRFLASQALMLALRGIPAVYFHGLVGTPNDRKGLERTGIARRINRRKFERRELEAILARRRPASRIFAGMQQLLAVRRAQPAFHPDAAQRLVETGHRSVLALERESRRPPQRLLVVANLAAKPALARFAAGPAREWRAAPDLLGASPLWNHGGRLSLEPGQALWLEAR